MITDTKLVWAEGSHVSLTTCPGSSSSPVVLSSKRFAHRWRSCNQVTDQGEPDLVDEASWRTANLELLAKAHTLGAIADISFHVIDSDYSVRTVSFS